MGFTQVLFHPTKKALISPPFFTSVGSHGDGALAKKKQDLGVPGNHVRPGLEVPPVGGKYRLFKLKAQRFLPQKSMA